MDIEKIRELLDELAAFMKENDLSELELDMDGAEVKLRKAGSPAQPPVIQQAAIPGPAVAVTAAAPSADAPPPERAAEQPGTVTITSPMVGSFYRAPRPEADAFAEVGDDVEEESLLCIIEAMKVMNEIKAEHKGRVVEILVENGEPVEYGQPLFVIAVES